jgi:hypothetical protein
MAEHAHDKLLSTLSRGVVKDEVTAKLAAVQAAVSTNEGSGSRTQILKESDRLDPSDPVSLLDSARVLMTAAPKVGSRGWTKASMATDLATYLYFAATVIEYFSDSLTEDSLKEAEGSGLLDELAACRQAFTAGPPFAWQQVSDCRSKCGLPRLPDWPTA